MVWVIARTNLQRLFRSKDYWIPLVILAQNRDQRGRKIEPFAQLRRLCAGQ